MDYNQTEVEELSILECIIGVFLHPVKTMRSLSAFPEFTLPILFMVIFSNAIGVINYNLMMNTLKEAYQKTGQLSQEQIQKMLNFGYISAQVSTTIMTVVGWLLFALALHILVKIFKGKSGFKKVLSIVGYAFLIKAVYYLIAAILIRVKGTMDSANLLTLAAFLKGDSNIYVKTLLQSIGIFGIWEMIVTGIGIYVMSGLSKAKTVIIILIPYVVMIAFSMGAAYIGTMAQTLAK